MTTAPLPRAARYAAEDIPLGVLARKEVRLFLTSLAILFVELMLIRWIPANVKYIGFFSNFLLIASFLGIGLGILLGRRGANPRISLFGFLMAAVVIYVFNFQLNVQIRSSNELFFGLAESSAADQNFLILPLIVALVAALLATLGAATRTAAEEHAAAEGLRHRHHRLDGRHRRLHAAFRFRH